jgi:hypothetical protein
MSDTTPTPRTDANRFQATTEKPESGVYELDVVYAEDYATLERELAARDARIVTLDEQRANQLQALGLSEDETTDIATEIRRIRDEGRANFHELTKMHHTDATQPPTERPNL